MAIYKLHRCKECNYKKRAPKPVDVKSCPICGGATYYSKNYYFTYYMNGKRHEITAGPDRITAKFLEHKTKSDINNGSLVRPVTFEQAMAKLRKSYRGLSDNTILMYENCVNHLSKHFGDKLELIRITEIQLEDFKDDMLLEMKGASFNRIRSTLKRMYALTGAPWNFGKEVFKREKEVARQRILDEEEWPRLMEAADKNQLLYTFIFTNLDLGLRKSSLLSLRWSDINFKENIVTKEGKGGKISRIPMTERLRDTLIKCRSSMKVLSPWVFPRKADPSKHIVNIYKPFNEILREAGIRNFRPHDLRRTFGSWVVMSTGNLALAQELLGHSSIETTKKHYGHLLDKHLRDGVETYEAYTGQ